MSKELKEIRRMISLQIENINKYLEIIKKEQNVNSGVKNTTIVIVKKKKKKKGLNSRFELVEERIIKLKDGSTEISQYEREKETRKRKVIRVSEVC